MRDAPSSNGDREHSSAGISDGDEKPAAKRAKLDGSCEGDRAVCPHASCGTRMSASQLLCATSEGVAERIAAQTVKVVLAKTSVPKHCRWVMPAYVGLSTRLKPGFATVQTAGQAPVTAEDTARPRPATRPRRLRRSSMRRARTARSHRCSICGVTSASVQPACRST